jgi:transcriptional regulator with XRE-family HTH domain
MMACFSGGKLRELRERKGLSLRSLACKLETSAMALSRYENGQREPGLRMMEKMAVYLNVPIDYFIQKEVTSMNDIYQLSIEKEVTVEFANNAINLLADYMLKAKISFEDKTNPIVILVNELNGFTDAGIPGMASIADVRELQQYLKHIYSYIEKLHLSLNIEQVA